ncbi:MAG TPA: DUF1707 domain-containing protein [Jiangellaceae bacterium]
MTAIRIGDTERDAAISALADHYAAGRLTKDEYDERADRANAARFDDDLKPLFADLPVAERPRSVTGSTTRRERRGPHPALFAAPLLWLAPLLTIGAIAVVAAVIVVISPWLLLAAFWFACAGLGCGRRNRHHHRTWARTRHHWQRV